LGNAGRQRKYISWCWLSKGTAHNHRADILSLHGSILKQNFRKISRFFARLALTASSFVWLISMLHLKVGVF
jgi:hypothetical protein